MNYPLISEYVEAIKLAEDNLNQLSYLRPVLDDEGRPVMSSGNFAVVFKMKDERNGKLHALKCFIKDQEGRDSAYKLIADELEYISSDFITPIQYLEKELFVDTSNSDVSEFPILLMDWVEGVTLDKYIREHLHDQYAIHLITFQFCRLASWLMAQSFAHGDIKPDNILVKEDGSLVLVDYDGMYVPAMKGQKAREIGSPDYRHPQRTIDDFNEHIDDFTLATIAMQLYAIALKPDQLTATNGDTLLLTETDYRDLSKCSMMSDLLSMVSDAEFTKLLGLFFMSFSENSLSNVSFRSFNINKPIRPVVIHKRSTTPITQITKIDIKRSIKDEYGVRYSKDGQKLLSAPDIESYKIEPGTKIICDRAFEILSLFEDESKLTNVIIPDSVTHIGDGAFSKCSRLTSIQLPDSVIHIGDNAFSGCERLSIIIPNGSMQKFQELLSDYRDKLIEKDDWERSLSTVVTDEDIATGIKDEFGAIYSSDGKRLLYSLGSVKSGIRVICDKAFFSCHYLTNITIPDSVTHIGDGAFSWCVDLSSITIPNSVTHIGDGAFDLCLNLSSITIPDSVTHIGDGVFSWCSNLVRIQVSVKNKEYDSRENCNAIIHTATNTLITGCNNTVIPNSVTHIGNNAFYGCEHLTSITIPDSVTHIGEQAFYDCRKLTSISIPDSVTFIGNEAFSRCGNLTSITIPDSVTSIGNGAFYDCNKLTEIRIPAGSYDKFKELLPDFKDILVEPPF